MIDAFQRNFEAKRFQVKFDRMNAPRTLPPPPPHPPPADPWYDESGVAEQRGVEARLGGGPEVSSHMKQTSMMSEIRRSDLCSSDTRGRFLLKE